MTETRESNYTGVFDTATGYGNRPAVLVIDFIRAYTTVGAPFFGQGVVDAVAHSRPLLEAARKAQVPVIYTKVLYHPSGIDGGLFVKKVPALRMLVEGEPLAEIDPSIPPEPRRSCDHQKLSQPILRHQPELDADGPWHRHADPDRLLDERLRPSRRHRRYSIRLSCRRAARKCR